jgi:hypothetical protein
MILGLPIHQVWRRQQAKGQGKKLNLNFNSMYKAPSLQIRASVHSKKNTSWGEAGHLQFYRLGDGHLCNETTIVLAIFLILKISQDKQ